MTLRAGFNTCTNYTTTDIIECRTTDTIINDGTVFIFYDIGATSSMEIAELGAYSSCGRHFSSILRTSTREINSPMVANFSPMTYMLVATEPTIAFEEFVTWVNVIMNETSFGTASLSDFTMALVM